MIIPRLFICLFQFQFIFQVDIWTFWYSLLIHSSIIHILQSRLELSGTSATYLSER